MRNSSCVYLWIYARPVSNVNVNDFSALPRAFLKLMNLRQRKVAISEQTWAKQTNTYPSWWDTILQNLWWISCLAVWARIMKTLRQKTPHLLMRLSDGQKCLFTHGHFRNDLEWQKNSYWWQVLFISSPKFTKTRKIYQENHKKLFHHRTRL